MRKQRTRKFCLECGALPRTRTEQRIAARGRRKEVIPSYLCSVECRDARDVKRAMGQPQMAHGTCKWTCVGNNARKGAIIRHEDALWLIIGTHTNPGYNGTATTLDVTLRRTGLRDHPRAKDGPEWVQWRASEA